MKEYKTNEELIEHLENKNIIIDDRNFALNIIDNYSYYSVINTYKYVFQKSDNTYFENVHFDEIYQMADDTIYQAKTHGRGKYVMQHFGRERDEQIR